MIASNHRIDKYIRMVEADAPRTNKIIKASVAHVKKAFETEEIFVDHEQLENYIGLAKYFPWKETFPWEEFVIGLHCCTYYIETGMPRWPELVLVTGRGTGKDGVIGLESMALTSPYNGIPQYNIDICANNKDQAIRPVTDLVDAFDNPKHKAKLMRHYYWTKERVKSKKTKSLITGHTANHKTKDGLRPGAVFYNELHQYENYNNIEVYKSALGKVEHPRIGYFTSQGYVREGPLDDLEKEAHDVLFGNMPDNGKLFLFYHLDNIEQIHDEKNWAMANPSLPYLPTLMAEIKRQYVEWKNNPDKNKDFEVKRMGLKRERSDVIVATWENILATKKPIPDMTGKPCVVGIDFTKVTDWAAINYHFIEGDNRIDLNHTWLCTQSKDLHRIKAPWQDWVTAGRITAVDDVEISPELIGAHLEVAMSKYQVKAVAIDNFRYAVMAPMLEKLGFSKKNKNLWLVRPSDIMKVVPVIERCFINQWFIWGNAPELRWATNNTKLIPVGKKEGLDKGNYEYGKIEAKSRKTDPFMALVASMVLEGELIGEYTGEIPDLDVIC